MRLTQRSALVTYCVLSILLSIPWRTRGQSQSCTNGLNDCYLCGNPLACRICFNNAYLYPAGNCVADQGIGCNPGYVIGNPGIPSGGGIAGRTCIFSPSPDPTAAPTFPPTTPRPTSSAPTRVPTDSPLSSEPTGAPSTSEPTISDPTQSPGSAAPTEVPTTPPSGTPTHAPSFNPTLAPAPTQSSSPTSAAPTASPIEGTDAPSVAPTGSPTIKTNRVCDLRRRDTVNGTELVGLCESENEFTFDVTRDSRYVTNYFTSSDPQVTGSRCCARGFDPLSPDESLCSTTADEPLQRFLYCPSSEGRTIYVPLPSLPTAWPINCNDSSWDSNAYSAWLDLYASNGDDGNPSTGPTTVDWSGVGDAPAEAVTDGCVGAALKMGEPYNLEQNALSVEQMKQFELDGLLPAGVLPSGLTADEMRVVLASFPMGCSYFPGFPQGARLWYNDLCIEPVAAEWQLPCSTVSEERINGQLVPNSVTVSEPPTLICGIRGFGVGEDCTDIQECKECRTCLFRPVDIIFVLDGSQSVPANSWRDMTQFVSDFLSNAYDAFEVDGETRISLDNRGLRAAVIAFGGDSTTVFNFTDLDDPYDEILAYRELVADCRRIQSRAECEQTGSQCYFENGCKVFGLAQCAVFSEQSSCEQQLACQWAGTCVKRVIPDPLARMSAALSSLRKPGLGTNTHLAVLEAIRMLNETDDDLSLRNRLMNMVLEDPTDPESWRDASSDADRRFWTLDDQARIVVLLTDGLPTISFDFATDIMRQWQINTNSSIVRLGMGLNPPNDPSFNITRLSEELQKFVRGTGRDDLDGLRVVDGVTEDINSARARVNIEFEDLNEYIEWIGRYFCSPPLCAANEYTYSTCSAYRDVICKPLRACLTSIHVSDDGTGTYIVAGERHPTSTHVTEPPYEFEVSPRTAISDYVCSNVTVHAPGPGIYISSPPTLTTDTVFSPCPEETWQPHAYGFCPYESGSYSEQCSCRELPDGFFIDCQNVPILNSTFLVEIHVELSACSRNPHFSYDIRTSNGDDLTKGNLTAGRNIFEAIEEIEYDDVNRSVLAILRSSEEPGSVGLSLRIQVRSGSTVTDPLLDQSEIMDLIVSTTLACGENGTTYSGEPCIPWTPCPETYIERTEPTSSSDRECDSLSPTAAPLSSRPTSTPTVSLPTSAPTTTRPTISPTVSPTSFPTETPTLFPSSTSPTRSPTVDCCSDVEYTAAPPTLTTARLCTPLTVCDPNEYEFEPPGDCYRDDLSIAVDGIVSTPSAPVFCGETIRTQVTTNAFVAFLLLIPPSQFNTSVRFTTCNSTVIDPDFCINNKYVDDDPDFQSSAAGPCQYRHPSINVPSIFGRGEDATFVFEHSGIWEGHTLQVGTYNNVTGVVDMQVNCEPTSEQATLLPVEPDSQCNGTRSATPDQSRCDCKRYTSDRICRESQPCPSGTYEVSSMTPTTDRLCENFTLCGLSEYEVRQPTNSTDRICAAPQCCEDFQYMLTDFTPTSDRVCRNLTECEVEAVPPIDCIYSDPVYGRNSSNVDEYGIVRVPESNIYCDDTLEVHVTDTTFVKFTLVLPSESKVVWFTTCDSMVRDPDLCINDRYYDDDPDFPSHPNDYPGNCSYRNSVLDGWDFEKLGEHFSVKLDAGTHTINVGTYAGSGYVRVSVECENVVNESPSASPTSYNSTIDLETCPPSQSAPIEPHSCGCRRFLADRICASTMSPTHTYAPTMSPTDTYNPTSSPSSSPTLLPTGVPTGIPTGVPLRQPTSLPTMSSSPSPAPTLLPSQQPFPIEITTTLSGATTTSSDSIQSCSRNCGDLENGGGTCLSTDADYCTTCNPGSYLIHGRCTPRITCDKRLISYGPLRNMSCRCLNRHCHKCIISNLTTDGPEEICNTCRDGWYLQDNRTCTETCDPGKTFSGANLFGRRCLDPFTCRSNRIMNFSAAYGCKCPNNANTRMDVNCHTCNFNSNEFGQECTKCRNGFYLYNSTCYENCQHVPALIPYRNGNYGSMCREPFVCTNGIDDQGTVCKCNPRSCQVCSWGQNGSTCLD